MWHSKRDSKEYKDNLELEYVFLYLLIMLIFIRSMMKIIYVIFNATSVILFQNLVNTVRFK